MTVRAELRAHDLRRLAAAGFPCYEATWDSLCGKPPFMTGLGPGRPGLDIEWRSDDRRRPRERERQTPRCRTPPAPRTSRALDPRWAGRTARRARSGPPTPAPP